MLIPVIQHLAELITYAVGSTFGEYYTVSPISSPRDAPGVKASLEFLSNLNLALEVDATGDSQAGLGSSSSWT